jgi:acetate---CoA ligase (ADP-forming)
MSHYQFPLPQHSALEGMALLKDDTTATLRRICREDESLLVTFLKHVSVDTCYKRFFGNVSVETASAKLLELVSDNTSLGLVVVVGDETPQIVAHGEYRRDPDSQAAEVAFIVADQYQGKGLGTLLLERLTLSACRQGIGRFYADTETSNVHMREVFKTSGFEVKEALHGPDVRITFDITPTATSVSRFELHERVATVVGSILAYPSVNAIPGEVDLAVITAPSSTISSILDDCGQKGVRAAIIISAGFAELGEAGRKQQEALAEKARAYGMRLIGPNCLGLLSTSPEACLNASFSPVFPLYGSIAMSSQSGALGIAVLELARERGLGLSSFVSLGNKADVSGNDLH